MKKMVTVLVLMCAQLVNANETVQTEIYKNLSGWKTISEIKYGVNIDLGRAWLEFNASNAGDYDDMGDDYRLKVEGLKFDIELNAVTFKNAGKSVICQQYGSKRFLGRNIQTIKDTKNCKKVETYKKVTIDDGFNLVKREYYIVNFVVDMSKAI